MYLNHFGLSEAPYRITPHTDFFFAGANRGATLEALLYAIIHDEGIVKVTGEVGSGKTMLCRVLMERLPPNVETIYLANPSLARDEIMLAILDDLKVPAAGERSSLILRALQERLVALYAEGRKVVVLIDEAHAMPIETLEEIRLLSNLESKRHKLLQIVLFGQQELDEILGTPQMRQLKERIVHGFRLEPLVRSDIGTYLMFRMRQAGYKGPDVFSDGAVRLITNASEGLTRRINILADKALLATFSDGGYQVLPKHASAAIADSEFARLKRSSGATLSTTVLAVAAVGLIATGAAAALLAVYIAIKKLPATTASLGAPIASVGPQATAPSAPAQATGPSAPMPRPAVGSAAQVQSDAAPKSAPTPQSASSSAPAASAANPAHQADRSRPAADNHTVAADTLLARRERVTEQWLREAPPATYTLQLLTADAARAGEIDDWLGKLASEIPSERIYVFNSVIRGSARYSVLYGAFPDRASAQAALTTLPKKLREGRPIVRTVDGIRADLQVQ